MERNEQLSALSYAVRGRVVLKYTGQLALVQSLLNLVPALVALLYGETAMAWRYALVSLALAGTAAPWVYCPAPKTFLRSEALVVVAVSFLIGAAVMVLPFMAAGLSFLDALFEAVSGITTTGLTTLSEVGGWPKSFLFARAWMQWCGGLGILVLTAALIASPHIAFRHLVVAMDEQENLITGITFYARRILLVYAILTLAAIVLLRLCGLDGFAAVAHALCAVSTGGFSSYDASIAELPFFPAQTTISLVSLLGAVSFSLMYRTFSQGYGDLFQDVESRGFLISTFLIMIALAYLLPGNGGYDWTESIRHAFLLAVSAQSTTGFSSLDVSELAPGAKSVLIAAMAIGGETGSTAGGIKILRLLILLRLVQYAVRRSGAPSHAVMVPRLNSHRLEGAELGDVLTFSFLFVALVFLSWIPFVALGHAPLDALFEIVSAMGTVGLSAGITAPELHPLLKSILCVDMLAGRLEIIALLVLLHPKTWIGKRMETL